VHQMCQVPQQSNAWSAYGKSKRINDNTLRPARALP
jgi:hypothetical protein